MCTQGYQVVNIFHLVVVLVATHFRTLAWKISWMEEPSRLQSMELQRVGHDWASLMAQTVNCQPAIWETWVRSLDRKDPLEKEMATHSSTLAWKVPWMEEPSRLQSVGSQRVRHD